MAIFVDGKRYADDGIMAAIGVTIRGEKIVLGIEQVHGENSGAISQWFEKLIERGLRYEQGILFIIDGSKGIRKAIGHVFGIYAIIQRCRWHKRENVLDYLDKKDQAVVRRRMQDAYNKTTLKEAVASLKEIHSYLERTNQSAANSLLEGLEETLTIHELGLSAELARSLGTTNCIECFMSQVGAYTDKVDRWRNSNMILRWTAASALDIEPRLRKIKGCQYLPVLRLKLQERIARNAEKKNPALTRELAVAV